MKNKFKQDKNIEDILKRAYCMEKDKVGKDKIIPEHLESAWNFIDNLFMLEIKNKGDDYFFMLESLVVLQEPKTLEERKEVFKDFLQLLGLIENSYNYNLIMEYYDEYIEFMIEKNKEEYQFLMSR